MKKKYSLILSKEFLQYCDLNDIVKIEKLAEDVFERGFTILKFGETPSFAHGKEIVKEVEKEVIKEIPVEVIKEVEKVVEVEVERIVEKEVYITDDEQVKSLTTKINDLEKQIKLKPKEVYVTDKIEVEKLKSENKKLQEDLDKITNTLSGFNRAKYIKSSDLGTLYDE